METVTLSVKGMSCNHCVNSIEGAVSELNGIKNVKVSLQEEKVAVDFNPDVVSLEKIKETIEDQGYEVAS